jgi:hypothetical protein
MRPYAINAVEEEEEEVNVHYVAETGNDVETLIS